MFIDFSDLPDDSRLWLYGSSEIISNDNQIKINKKIKDFLQVWTHHEKPLMCSSKFLYNRFIIVGLDENFNQTGGCSMDGLQKLILSINQEFRLDLYKRFNVFVLINDKIKCIDAMSLKENELISYNTMFYNLNIQVKKELKDWLIPIKHGWCKRFLD